MAIRWKRVKEDASDLSTTDGITLVDELSDAEIEKKAARNREAALTKLLEKKAGSEVDNGYAAVKELREDVNKAHFTTEANLAARVVGGEGSGIQSKSRK